MQNKRGKNTKKKIVSAAWKLFYEQGYDNTTVDDIIELSATSKGSFYHYFEGKDALLSSLSFLFDEKYEELIPTLQPDMDSFDKLLYLNQELFNLIESCLLYTSQHKHLPEMQKIAGLAYPPVFNPIVADFFCGMVVTVPLHVRLLRRRISPAAVAEAMRSYYAGPPFIKVHPLSLIHIWIPSRSNSG